MKPRTKITITLLTVALVSVGGYMFHQQRKANDPENRFRTATLETGKVVQTVSANGTLTPLVLVNVGTQVSGTVRKMYVDFNDKVTAGQKLLELDQSLLQTVARQSAANVGNVEASHELARANEARMRALLDKEYVSRQEYDQAAQLLKSTQAQLQQARAAADRDRVNLSYSVITSPVSGVVVARLVDVGQTVAASFQTPTLIQIAQDLSKMAIDTSFAEADIGSIREGLKVRFTVDAFPNRNFTGVVQQIRLNPSNQQNVVTYNVRIRVENPELILLPGMTAYVSIGVQERNDVLLVPNAALRFKPAEGERKDMPAAKTGAAPAGGRERKREAQGGTVYVLADGEIRPVSVQIGITDNRNTEVVSGELKAGDRVILGENGTRDKKPSSVGMRMF